MDPTRIGDRLSDMAAQLPHDGVLTRLGVSRIKGVGVFAIVPIAAGTDVFCNDRAALRWVDAEALDAGQLPSAQKNLYVDFAVRRGDRLGCPANFNLLTVGWYVNEPPDGIEPNLRAAPDCTLIARRDIAAGEELTVIYDTFSEVESAAALALR